jgi:pyrroline-5-carboxylate reductase
MPLSNLSLSFIGSGVMGEAMIKGLLHQKRLASSNIIATDIHSERGAYLKNQYGIQFTHDNRAAAEASDVVVLSVKPQVMGKALGDLKGRLKHGALVLSIAAGVKLRTLVEGSLNPAVVRSMPNTPAQIGQGITVWTATSEVNGTQREWANAILSAMGEALYVEEEKFLDMATALNGSGPAYVFLFMEALIDAGVHMGFSRHDAERLVTQTMRGSVEYAISSKLHPAQLRNQVTSPGGTSAEALYELEKGGLRTVIADAVWAAYRRAADLGK